MEKVVFDRIIEKYLEDDGLDRDIVVLANDMGFQVGVAYTKKDFLALTKVDKSSKLIILNKSRVNDEKLLKFILAYQLVEFIKFNEDEFYSTFVINQMDMDIYKSVQLILERTDKYKDSDSKIKKKSFNKKNKNIIWRHDL